MSNENLLPQKIDPFRFAENEVVIKGVIPLKSMERLLPSLYSDVGYVTADMKFDRDEQGICIVRGHYDAHLTLQCQRCMEAFEYKASGELLLGVVSTEEEVDTLPKGYDAVIVQDGILLVNDVIEDELILSLPIVAMHESKDCKVIIPVAMDSTQHAETERENPFKVIELLRKNRNVDK